MGKSEQKICLWQYRTRKPGGHGDNGLILLNFEVLGGIGGILYSELEVISWHNFVIYAEKIATILS
jgi:hypothetical protein